MYWVLGAVFMMFLLIAGYWMSSLEGRVSVLENDMKVYINDRK